MTHTLDIFWTDYLLYLQILMGRSLPLDFDLIPLPVYRVFYLSYSGLAREFYPLKNIWSYFNKKFSFLCVFHVFSNDS